MTFIGAELLLDAIAGRRERRSARRQQRQTKKVSRKAVSHPSPVDKLVKGARYYVRVSHFGHGPTPSSRTVAVNTSSYAAAQRGWKDARGWDELKALKGQIEYPEVIVYELWDNTGARPILRERWDTTQVDPALKRQYMALNL